MKIRHGTWKIIITAVAVIAVLAVGAAALTSAYLFDRAVIVNKTEKGVVTNEISEDFNGIEKTNVKVQNTGDIPAYVRIAIVAIWRDEEGNPTTLTAKDTYTISFNEADWFIGNDGFYYYKKPIAPTEFTPVLIEKCTVNENLSEEYNGKIFDLQVLAQSVQSVPKNTVTEIWNISVNDNGYLIENKS